MNHENKVTLRELDNYNSAQTVRQSPVNQMAVYSNYIQIMGRVKFICLFLRILLPQGGKVKRRLGTTVLQYCQNL